MGNEVIGSKLRQYRIKSGKTLKQVADAMGIASPSTIGSWETGKSEPPIETLLKLFQYYGIGNPYELVDEEYTTMQLTNEETYLLATYRHNKSFNTAVNAILDLMEGHEE